MPKRNGDGIALLADPTRRAIIAILALRPTRPSRLAAQLGLSQPALARHLRLLATAGLIWRHTVPGDGRGVLYTINPTRHGVITAWLAGTEIERPTDPFAAPATPPAETPADRIAISARGVIGLVRRPIRDRSQQAE